MVSPAVSPISPASAFAPGPVCLGFAVVGLFRGLSRVPARCYSYSPADGLRAEALPVRCVYPGPFPLRDRILIFFSVFAFFLFSLINRAAQIAHVPCSLFSVLLLDLRFSVSISHMCEPKINKKALQHFLKFLIFPPYPLHVIFPYALYMADFLFYRSQVGRETCCSILHRLMFICPDFSAIAKSLKNLPKISETGCFR